VSAEHNGRVHGRAASLRTVSTDKLEAAWRRSGAELLLERRYPSGRRVISIHHHPDVGFRVAAPGYGRHLIAADGAHIDSALPEGVGWRWQRLLFAQVLPLAATLRGFEVVHASAVALGGRAIAFLAPSGHGKTSTAAHLVGRGADFVADDVVALEPTSRGVMAHPGAALAAIDPAELHSMAPAARSRIGERIGRAGKDYVSVRPPREPLPLAAVYFLGRGSGSKVEIDGATDTAPQAWLTSSFVMYLETPDRLLRHLDMAARLSSDVPAFNLRVPPGNGAADVAAAVERHATERL
jgi:hypothetical protein